MAAERCRSSGPGFQAEIRRGFSGDRPASTFMELLAREARIRAAVTEAWRALPKQEQAKVVKVTAKTGWTKCPALLPWEEVGQRMAGTRPMTPEEVEQAVQQAVEQHRT